MVAIACQQHYIETELGVSLTLVSGMDDGSPQDDAPPLQPLPVIVCAWCGLVGHTQGKCDDYKIHQLEDWVPEERF